ncbi:MAG TPA: GerMN domain-containing protein [Thermoanaerobaculia bacterium]|nr:GerMN domain-containing protein [Thermoanaerobaculia bacterium]
MRPRARPALAVLLAVFSCAPGPAPSAWSRTEAARIFLVELHDGGVGGPRIGCGDSIVGVEVALPSPRPALRGALEALLAIDTPYHPASGLYSALHASPLEIRRLRNEEGRVRVDLAGWVELQEACDGPRVREQLDRTARQFSDVSAVEFWVDGVRLDSVLPPR